MYFADRRWWHWHRERSEFAAFRGQKCSIQCTGSDVTHDDVHLLRNDGSAGMPRVPNALTMGMHSGYQSVLLALLAGARRVILLGFDGRFRDEGKQQRSHWHEGHPVEVPEDMYVTYARQFKGLKVPSGSEVLNASPGSTITAFQRADLAEALARA